MPRQCQRFRQRLRLGIHVHLQGVARESSRAVKNRAVEIFVERYLAALKRLHDHFVAILKFDGVQLELRHGQITLRAIPGVG